MTELEAIKTVSDQFRRDGYTVVAQADSALAPLLEVGDVDLIATRGDEIRAIILKRGEELLNEPVIVDLGHHAQDHSLSLLAEAEKLRGPETRRASLLMGWAAFEAAAREILATDRGADDQRTAAQLIDELVKRDAIASAEAQQLRQVMLWRNLLTHNVQPTEIVADKVVFLLETVKKLKNNQLDDRLESAGGSCLPAVIRTGLGRDDRLAATILRLAPIFDEVLGMSCPEVLAEWDRATDDQGESRIILKLSDFHGAVSGVFTLDELARPVQFRSRLNQLWSQLLQFRIDHLLARLTA